MKTPYMAFAATLVFLTSQSAIADSHVMQGDMMSNGLMMPSMSSSEGRKLFASKGCVVCHSVNGVGGEDASMLDAEFMDIPMNPFEFAARMWRGAPAMIEAQEDELGYQIEFTGEELAAIIAFVHDPDEQAKFSEADIPDALKEMMEHLEEEEDHD
ncbi:c-type cytochrome [Halovulum marinum]|nr:c-type cytochrome [Halovulum marinum]